jgi:hypothetical protein
VPITSSASQVQEGIMSVITKSSVLAAVFIGTFVVSARAEGPITVKIPFPFVVDHKEFPAGHYDIRSDELSGGVIWIEGMDNKSVAVAFTTHVEGRDPAGADPALVFTRSENTYQLSQIWESRSDGRELTGISGPRHGGRSKTQSAVSETVTITAEANSPVVIRR